CGACLWARGAIRGPLPAAVAPVGGDGPRHEEMPGEGGASARLFLYPPSLRGVAQSMGLEMTRPGRVYIIRNSMLTATEAKTIERRTISIAQRAINSLIHTQGLGDLYRIYMTTTRDGLDFNLAYIGPDFMYENK